MGCEPAKSCRTCLPPSLERSARCTHAAWRAVRPSSWTISRPAERNPATASCTPRRTATDGSSGPASSHQAIRSGLTAESGIRGGSGAMTPTAESARSKSATCRARKPARGCTAVSSGIVRKLPPSPSAVDRGTIPATPQACAGCRILPARSFATASGTTPAATKHASPPLLPPGPRPCAWG